MTFTVSMTGGSIEPGDGEKAAKGFSKLFRVDLDKAQKIIGSGKARPLAKNLTEDKARKLLQRLDQLGIPAAVDPPFSDQEPGAKPVLPGLSLEDQVAKQPAEESTLAIAPEPALDPAPSVSNASTADEPDEGDNGDLTEVNPVPAMNGLGWISASFEMLKAQPFQWIASLIGFFLLSGVPGAIPVVGGYIMIPLFPLLFAGLMVGAHEQASTGSFPAMSFLSGFTHRPLSLAVLGIVTALISIPTFFLVGLVVALMGLGGIWVPLILSTIILFPIILINLLAPSLVAIRGLGVMDAVKWSVIGGFRNVVPIVLNMVGYGVVALVISMTLTVAPTLGLIAVVLGSLLLVQLFTCSVYLAYADIFE